MTIHDDQTGGARVRTRSTTFDVAGAVVDFTRTRGPRDLATLRDSLRGAPESLDCFYHLEGAEFVLIIMGPRSGRPDMRWGFSIQSPEYRLLRAAMQVLRLSCPFRERDFLPIGIGVRRSA